MQSLTDNGNTDLFLASIAILAPNNFTQFYNQLMAASPYLSDEVLISFMTNPINKPAHKKDVVLANSPLPYNARPYIDLMNVNQNFKDLMWAAQNGSPNARVQLENYIKWLGNRRQQEINSLAIKCNRDTLGYETDSLINYLASSAILTDRIIRYGLLLNKADYNSALNELPVINSLTGDLSIEKQSEYNDLTNISEILISAIQLPDSTADSLVLSNHAYLESIANTEFHIAQGDAKALLEQAGVTQEYIAWLPNGSAAKSMKIPGKTGNNEPATCNSLVVYPNPSNGNMLIKYDLNNEEGIAEIKLIATDGKIMNTYKLSDSKGEIRINCSTCITGNYMLTLYINDNSICNKELNIKK